MEREFRVIAIEMCSECGGSGVVEDPRWTQCFQELHATAEDMPDGQALRRWWSEHGVYVLFGGDLPPVEIACPVCAGRGEVQEWVPVLEALEELGLGRRISIDTGREQFSGFGVFR